MGENITKIKVGDDVHCISLDTEVIDTDTLCFFGTDGRYTGKLGVKLGSSIFADSDGIGVKIHPDTRNYLQREPYGLSLKLDTMAESMANLTVEKFCLAIDGYNNLKIDTGIQPLKLGTGLIGDDNDKTLCLSLGSGLGFAPSENKIRLKIDDDQDLLMLMPDGTLTLNLNRLYEFLEARYNLTKK